MRQNYPVSSQEMLTGINEIQEALISLIGYDANSFDDFEEIVGKIGELENQLDAAQNDMLTERLYKNLQPGYETPYHNALRHYLARRTHA